MISPSVPTEARPRRHDFATIDPLAWRAMRPQQEDDPRDSLLKGWADAGRPLVRRRRSTGEQSGIPLGLPLPPTHGKRRLCLLARPEAVLAWAPPPLLTMVPVPERWLSTQAAIIALGARHGVHARVFGSFAWSALTGLDYLNPASDLDLLFPLPKQRDLAGLTEGLLKIEATSPAAIDGEIVRRDGAAVNWRELHQGSTEVLVKSLDEVVLRKRSWFLDEESAS